MFEIEILQGFQDFQNFYVFSIEYNILLGARKGIVDSEGF